MTDLDELRRRIDHLYDRAHISDTINRFFLALDEKDWDAIPPLLADEFLLTAATVAGEPKRLPIPEFMQSLVARNGGFAGTTHLNPDHIITIDGDSAHVKAHMLCPHWSDDTDAGLFVSYGRYDIDLLRSGDGWEMTDLIIRIDGSRGDAASVYSAAAMRLASDPTAAQRIE
ncbi:nuclear transport factor 2 family protein [Herbiconiux sp. UC225_62]|uniref:nuclear transport factor 2 family protein n=1 Tax=Herbiconiux sp. UC225_62 TaxID=3350168 RepID=UPI0036D20BF3